MRNPWFASQSSRTLFSLAAMVLAVLMMGASFARDKAGAGLNFGKSLTISEPRPVFLRVSPERLPIKTVDPATAPRENGQLVLDVDVTSLDLIDVDVDASSPSAFYMHFYYWTKDGADLPITDSYYSLRLANDPDAWGQRFINRFEALPVNRRADTLDRMIFPEPPMIMTVHELSFHGRKLITDAEAAAEDMAIAGRISDDPGEGSRTDEISVTFAARDESESKSKIAARGLAIEIENLLKVYQVGLDHRPIELPLGPTRIGKFAPQTLILTDSAGDVHTIGTHGADLIEVVRSDDKATITIYDYHVRERTHHFKQRNIDAGIRLNINPGLTHRLRESMLTVFRRKGPEVAFLSRHPAGHLATMTIGEHADHVIVENDPLIMFGHDDGEVRVDGKGFIGNDIPITRSVYGAGGGGISPLEVQRRKVWQDENTPRVNETVPSLGSSDELRRLLDLYRDLGARIEYAPHSAAATATDVVESTKNRKTMQRALQALRPYAPRVSIDHGGLETIHTFGWNAKDEVYYNFDLLLDEGIEYFYPLADKLSGAFSMLFPDQASNIFYQLPSVDLPSTTSSDREPYFFSQLQLSWDQERFSMPGLEEMLDQRSMLNLHTYLGHDVTLPVFDDAGAFKGGYTLIPWFNQHLQNIDAVRDRGDLWLGLNSELYDFQRSLDAMALTWRDNCIEVSGQHRQEIGGVTLAVAFFDEGHWSAMSPNGTTPNEEIGSRSQDRIDYLWFDLAPDESRLLCPSGAPST